MAAMAGAFTSVSKEGTGKMGTEAYDSAINRQRELIREYESQINSIQEQQSSLREYTSQINECQNQIRMQVTSIVGKLAITRQEVLHGRGGCFSELENAVNGEKFSLAMSALASAAEKCSNKTDENESGIWELNNRIQTCYNEIDRLESEKRRQMEEEAAAALAAAQNTETGTEE